jgi:hypothetical protein
VIDEEIFCPLCQYNLRGLTVPRCPECGHRFAWPEVLDPRQRLHPFLFEHHPEKKFSCFWRTLVGGLRPRRFWSSLRPVQPSFPRRLIAYWCLSASLFVLATVVPVVYRFVWMVRLRAGLLGMSVDRALSASLPDLACGVLIVNLAVVWPWLTFLILMVFQVSMRRAKVRPIHVLRCVLYSADLIWWGGLLLIMAMVLSAVYVVSFGPGLALAMGPSVVFFIVAWPVASYRLWVAYSRYLRFDRPFLTVLASQVILVLVLPNLLVLASLLARWG